VADLKTLNLFVAGSILAGGTGGAFGMLLIVFPLTYVLLSVSSLFI